ncbi:hypothetical protein QFC21_000518 [Naganishia friedmannii]|uniref:Uncharacterized protein n=1 Tax=Naganishia friedmannii TaxID=89922 RepID=A0ACC2WD95_9TREE|nr:hypothetical protein QFC21_000518 [Naganishia friedmannii]
MDINHLSAALARVSDPSFDSVELFYASHPGWPAVKPVPAVGKSEAAREEDEGKTPPRKRQRIHIAVFDSSFNPPTRAHLAISLTSYPPRTSLPSITSSAATTTSTSTCTSANVDEPYTARLLLLSARNVDKTPKPGDATFVQRIEMMRLQALDMEENVGVTATSAEAAPAAMVDDSAGNVAVAALNHPTFVGKSDILLRWLRRQRFTSSPSTLQQDSAPAAEQDPEIRLTFLIGTDTLLRLFIPKYYTPAPRLGRDMDAHLRKLFQEDGSDIVVAHRGASRQAREEEERFVFSQPACRDLVASGKIRFVQEGEVGEAEREMSSTRVRRALLDGREAEARLLMGKRVGEYVVKEGLYRV